MTPPALSDSESSWNPSSADLSLLHLPRELVLLILDCLPESELLKLCEVSSESQQLALLSLLARHGVSESQIQSQELSNITSRAIRSLCVSCPTLISNIRRLDLNFTDGDVDHLHPWRSLVHLAERFPVIPRVTFTFSDRSTASKTYSGLWNLLPTTLIALMGNHSRPVVIIHYVSSTAVQPKLPNLLKRAWKKPKRASVAVPIVDKMKLTRKLLSSIATATTRRLLARIYLRSFTEPSAPLGALLILNPEAVFYLDIGEHVISRPEWQFLMSELHLPSLRTIFIRIDFDHGALSAFLERHNKIEHLEFLSDWSCIYNHIIPPFSISALPCLKHISASSRVIAHILQTPNVFPLLQYVGIDARESSSDDPDDATSFQEALRALAARTSVTTLILHIHSGCLPWVEFDGTEARAERELGSIQKLQLLPWTHDAEHNTFPSWLAMFPGVHDLSISGNLFQPTKGPLVSDWLIEAINAACPHIVVSQERRLDLR